MFLDGNPRRLNALTHGASRVRNEDRVIAAPPDLVAQSAKVDLLSTIPSQRRTFRTFRNFRTFRTTSGRPSAASTPHHEGSPVEKLSIAAAVWWATRRVGDVRQLNMDVWPADLKAGGAVDGLTALFALESVKGFGPQKFKALHAGGVSPTEVLQDPGCLPLKGKRADDLRAAINELDGASRSEAGTRARQQLERAAELSTRVLTYGDHGYPRNVYESNNPVPVLYARGDLGILGSDRVVACVGSRDIADPYDRLHASFAATAVDEGFAVSSGFALGADSVGHRSAHDHGGSTICVMPSGLDLPFPPENRSLWTEFLEQGRAVFISEFAFGRRADSLTLRKRNKLIVASALGVLVSQSSSSGGAMNAHRFSVEQKKPVATFAPDGTDRTSGNAQIAVDPKAKSTVLGQDRPGWEQWLRALS